VCTADSCDAITGCGHETSSFSSSFIGFPIIT